MPIDFENTELTELTPKIAVIGVGGAGCNAVNNMIAADLQGVDFIVANTDAQALANSKAGNRIQLGVQITQGLGSGSQPKIGAASAEEAIDQIDEMLDGVHMAFVTCGMGGGTGTGAAPVIAKRARERNILTVGVVTKPFHFEGGRRMKIAESGIGDLAGNVDTLIVIPNQNLFRVADEKTTFADAFGMADEVLHSGVRSITDLMVMPGLINLDFADVRTVMSEMGKAMMGTGQATGDNRAVDAAAAAISNPLLEEASLKGAKGVIINVTGGMDMTLYEVDEAVNMVRDLVDPDALIVFGSAFSPEADGQIRVSVVATGIDATGATLEAIPQPKRETAPTHHVAVEETQSAVEAQAAAEQATPQVDVVAEQSPDLTETASADRPAEDTTVEDTRAKMGAEPVQREAQREAQPEPQPEVNSEVKSGPLQGVAVAAESMAPPKEDPEARALAARGADMFVADMPKEPKAEMPTFGKADPFQAADYENTLKQEVEGKPALEQQEAAPAADEKVEKKKSLFEMMTSGLRGGNTETVAVNNPARPVNDAGAVEAASASLGGVSADDRPAPKQADTEQLEIPSFLRRQGN